MFGFFKKKATPKRHAPNPHIRQKRSFYSADVDRVLSGWNSTSNSIDYYLQTDLTSLRARSREMVRKNPYAKRFITAIKSNIVGPSGVGIQAQSVRMLNGKLELDTLANDAIEEAFKDWADSEADYREKLSFIDLQNMAITSVASDGEFIFEVQEGKKYGKYGFQLKFIDAELLDVSKNTATANGGEVRLGVEYDSEGRVIWYHFKQRSENGSYGKGESYKVAAKNIIHGFISDFADQSRGIPWMHASLERTKNLDSYDHAAMISARHGASKMMVLSSKGGDAYTGDEDGEGAYEGSTLDSVEPGSIHDIGDREMQQFDPAYPHQMYEAFVKSTLRGIASGIGVSYHSISNDLEGVNYSSIRAGVLEDREIFKAIQEWFIRVLIKPVYRRWVSNAVLNNSIKIGRRPLSRPVDEYFRAKYQARRWAWVDPQKDGQSNNLAIQNRTKSRSQVMREQGDDPESVWREIEREETLLKDKGLLGEQDDADSATNAEDKQAKN